MQTSMFEKELSFPHTYVELDQYYDKYIRTTWEEADAFTWNPLLADGRSYFFYGQKIFEFYPGNSAKAKLKLPGYMLRKLMIEKPNMKDTTLYSVTEKDLSTEQLQDAFMLLAEKQKDIFRNTVTEIFGCCNDFMKCSDEKKCLYPEDRFYNGCQYRRNLEAGRIFYGKNRNIDGDVSL